MIDEYLFQEIITRFPFNPTVQQRELMQSLTRFLVEPNNEKLFILKGYAGTGKTSIVSTLVQVMHEIKVKSVLLAPTGRAAKVLSSYAGFPAFTIHKKIYRQRSLVEDVFSLTDNLHTNTLFIVDEVSMISNVGGEKEFSSGRLLDDLIRFVYLGTKCSLLFVGDTAQLPPVMQEESPALNVSLLEGYGLSVTTFTLTQVMRQALESGILYNATLLRKALEDNLTSFLPKLKLSAFSDIIALNGMELIEEIQNAYNGVGIEDTIIITRSNKQAGIYNNGIRSRVMMREEEISNGDLLMITRNNYFWNKTYQEIDFIANGDIVEVLRVSKHSEMYGFRFVELTLRSVDFNWEIDARIWLDSLQSESPSQMNVLNQQLFDAVSEDYSEIKNKQERYQAIFSNAYLNALQVKFAYSVTCHKAQGGQWKQVFIDMNIFSGMTVDRNYYRWLYTALTRATDKVFLINYNSIST